MEVSSLKWQLMKAVLQTVGRVSEGVSLGYRYGFDSGEMLDYVYENQARGRLGIGRVVDRIYLNAIGWRGIRARKELLKSILSEAIRRRSQEGLTTTVLDIASGPGRYLQEVFLDMKASGHLDGVTAICRDLDEMGLEQGLRQARERGLTDMRFEVGDACDPASLATVSPQPDIVVSSGLYELLDSPLIQRSMQGAYHILPPGGRFIFTTQVNHPQLEMIANVLVNRHGEPWVMVCRPLAEPEGWAEEAGFKIVGSYMEEVGLFGVTLCEKRQSQR